MERENQTRLTQLCAQRELTDATLCDQVRFTALTSELRETSAGQLRCVYQCDWSVRNAPLPTRQDGNNKSLQGIVAHCTRQYEWPLAGLARTTLLALGCSCWGWRRPGRQKRKRPWTAMGLDGHGWANARKSSPLTGGIRNSGIWAARSLSR